MTNTVGGVTSGYCEIGSVNNATMPSTTNMMDSTAAKIGRLMKKCENFTVVSR